MGILSATLILTHITHCLQNYETLQNYESALLTTIHVFTIIKVFCWFQGVLQDYNHSICQLPMSKNYQNLAKLSVHENNGTRPPVGHHYSGQSKSFRLDFEQSQLASLYQHQRKVALQTYCKYVGSTSTVGNVAAEPMDLPLAFSWFIGPMERRGAVARVGSEGSCIIATSVHNHSMKITELHLLLHQLYNTVDQTSSDIDDMKGP